MLIGLDPLLGGKLLQILRDLGHGDTICIGDCNFPGHEIARKANAPWVPMHCDAIQAGRAILSVFPLDSFVEVPVRHMEQGGGDTFNDAHRDFKAMMHDVAGPRWQIGGIERFAFYDEAVKCSAVISTLERRGYACFILKKGVLGADGAVV